MATFPQLLITGKSSNFLRGALFSQVCPKCFNAKINLDLSKGSSGTIKIDLYGN
jgi:hypothetical protein